MNLKNYQTNFDFSRAFDLQKNLNNEFANDIFKAFITNVSLKKNKLFQKHFNFVITELFFCWLESREQFLSVSMSKRGYRMNSRYNPNKISSYCIKIIRYLKENEFLEFYPGFFDSRKNKSRLSRIKAKKKLVDEFTNVKLNRLYSIHHEKREFIYLYVNNILNDYDDNFKTHELREILGSYNKIIQKNLFDIPCYDADNFKNYNGKLINLFISNSVLNCYFLETLSTDPILGGCWWDRLDESYISKYKKNFRINNKESMYIDLLEILPNFLSSQLNCIIKISSSRIEDLSYSEKCYIFLKYIRSKNKDKFIHTFLREKKRYGFGEYNNSELKRIMKAFINNNEKVFKLINDGVYNKWLKFCSKVFIELIKVSLNSDNPIYLVKDKIYFCINHEKNVKTNLAKILEKILRLVNFELKSNYCINPNDRSGNFFVRMFNHKSSISNRYITNLKNFDRKKNYGS